MLAIARNARNAAATCKMRRRGVPCLLDRSVHVVHGMLHGRFVSARVGSVAFEVHRKIGIEFDLWMDTVTRSAHQAAEHGVCAGWKVRP